MYRRSRSCHPCQHLTPSSSQLDSNCLWRLTRSPRPEPQIHTGSMSGAPFTFSMIYGSPVSSHTQRVYSTSFGCAFVVSVFVTLYSLHGGLPTIASKSRPIFAICLSSSLVMSYLKNLSRQGKLGWLSMSEPYTSYPAI